MNASQTTRRALVVIPVVGHHDMTHAVLEDLRSESALVDVVVVDNGGDYPTFADESVLRPGENLGWAGGTNLGTRELLRPHHAGAIWLNNDTRLSRGFVAGLLEAAAVTGAGVVGPTYDCYWLHQRLPQPVPVDRFRPRRRHSDAPFVDGTCMFVASSTIDSIGVLDEDTFAPIGWGADLDYCFRAREAGHRVVVTRLAYLHHEKSITGVTVYDGLEGYASEGYPVLVNGLEAKWGADWRARAGIDPLSSQTTAPRRLLRRLRPLGRAAR
jgi:GT2 family glycosyltransferase